MEQLATCTVEAVSRLKIAAREWGTLKSTLALESAVPLSWTTVSSTFDELVIRLDPYAVKVDDPKIDPASLGTENPVIF